MEHGAASQKRYTVAEYYAQVVQLDTPAELLQGEIVAMASPNIQHQRIVRGLTAAIHSYLQQKGGKCEVFSAPTDVMLDAANVVTPDVFIACHPERFDAQKYNGAPDFVAEVVSSNRSDDYIKKLYLYQTAGVREYWIIDPRYQRTLVYDFTEGHAPTVYPFQIPIPVGIYRQQEAPLMITLAALANLATPQ